MVFEPAYPKIDRSAFKECNWKAFYSEAEEPVAPNMPETHGKEVDCCLYVDSDWFLYFPKYSTNDMAFQMAIYS
jgi:hypothetical protein